MTNIDPEKRAAAQLKTQTQVPKTRASELRDILKSLETRLTKLNETTPESALEILTFFDQADQILDELQERGMTASSERGQIETISAQFRKKRELFIRRIGGPEALALARKEHQPQEDRWWWYVDKSLAVENKEKTLRLGRNFVILAVVLLIAGLLYNQFLAPDPAVQASYGHRQQAETSLMEGKFDEALKEVQDALELTPNYGDLYVLEGVILEALERPEEALESYAKAQENIESQDQFHTQRAIINLMMGNAEQALVDSEMAIQLNPDSALSYLTKAQAYEMMGDISKAIDSFEEADEVAQRIGNYQLQAIIRVGLANVYQRISIPTFDETNVDLGE
ncbi:MAG: hypothetical protein MUO62_07885 [Anaerolineales bacterium]|nr:hypothetical protein [Anaerolineales bacterium]